MAKFFTRSSKVVCYFNENNLLPHRAFGTPVQLSNGISVGDRVLNFLIDIILLYQMI